MRATFTVLIKQKPSSMQHKSFQSLVTGLFLISSLSYCNKTNDHLFSPPKVTVPNQLSIDKLNFVPEDVLVYKNKVYVSGFGDGTIQKFDLTKSTPTAEEIISTNANNPSRWGLAVDERKQTLLNIANVNYAFDGSVPAPAKVFAYKLSDNSQVSSWTLPDGTVGNSIVAVNGYYYISDIGPNTRIIRLNPNTGEMVIKTDILWPSLGFGFGNLIYANNGLYGGVNSKMWFIPIDVKGNFGTVSEVNGLSNVFSDGMAWAGDNTFYYAENDALNPLNVGKVWTVSLTSNITATAALTSKVTNNGSLNNPSGVFFTKINKQKYLFVNESQLLNQKTTPPFKINIFQVD